MVRYRDFSVGERLIFITSICMLLPYYFGIAVLVADFIYILSNGDFRELISGFKSFKWFIAFSIYSAIMCVIFKNSYGFFATLVMVMLLVYFAYFREHLTERVFKATVDAMLFISSFWFLNTVVQAADIYYLSGQGMDGFLRFISRHRADSVFFNPNYYGAVGDLMFMFGLFRYIKAPNFKRKLLYGGYMLLAAMAVFLSGSRGAQIALIFGALYLSIKLRDRLTTMMLIGGIMICLGIVVETGNLINTRVASVGNDYQLRMSIWNSSLKYILSNPMLGAGPLGIHAIYPSIMSRTVIHSHNLLLDFLVNYGVIGAILIYPFFKRLYREVRKNKRTDSYSLTVAMTVLVLAHGLIDVTIFWHQTAYIYFMMVFSAHRLSRSYEHSQSEVQCGNISVEYLESIGTQSYM